MMNKHVRARGLNRLQGCLADIGVEEYEVRIAVPVENGRLADHFGHSPGMAIFTMSGQQIIQEQTLETPPHEPGVLPPWLKEHGVDVVIAGRIGPRALSLFDQLGIRAVFGAPAHLPAELAVAYASGALTTGPNECDHGDDHHC